MIYKLNHVYIYIYGSVHYTQLLEADYGWSMINYLYIYIYIDMYNPIEKKQL